MLVAALCMAASLTQVESGANDQANRLATLSPLGSKPLSTVIVPDHEPLRMEVKFVDGSDVNLIGGSFLAESPEVFAIDQYLDSQGIIRHRVFSQDDAWLDEFRAKGEERSGRPLHDLTLFYGLEMPEAGMIAEVCDTLNTFSIVEIAYPLGRVTDPVIATAPALGVTPDFESFQGYRTAAPMGIDADYGNTFAGGSGLGITIADVETGWTDDHEDISHQALGNYVGLTPQHYPWDHGTAVLGELVGEHNASGVRGSVYKAGVLMSTHQGSSSNIPTAIMNAIAAVGPGDAVVLEVQCFGTPPGPFPCEYVASTFSSVEAATANGIHVFAAAGNGDNDLDSAPYGGLFDRNVRDSGAVMVGASDGSSLNKASFSNYGTRCDAHGWGFNVATTGYGDLQGGPATEEYTNGFSGTSSATPIVTGAGLILNGIEMSVHGAPLDPLVLRSLLTTTGTPQGSGGQIGPRPNVRDAIAARNLPRIEVSGNLVPGGNYTVNSKGPAGAVYVLVFSSTLRNDRWTSPWGEMFLASPWTRVVSGVLPGSGSIDYNASIPNDGSLSGTTFGYYQGWQRYVGTNGGSFANYAPVEVQ